MAAYSYQALDPKGKKIKGILEGDSERQIRNQLRSKQLKPLDVKSVRAKPDATTGALEGLAKYNVSFGGPRMKTRDLSLVTRQLASLVQSGLPLDEVLGATARQSRKANVKGIMLQVRSRVVEGLSLTQAMSELPKVFDNLYRAMIRAGESSGYLGPVLEQLSEYTERAQETQQKLKSAMVYPIVMVFVSISIVTLLMVKVVPQLVGLFENNSRELPFVTRLLIGISDFLVNYGILLAGAIAAFVFFLSWLLKDKGRQRKWHAIQLRLPVFGNFILQSETARYSSTLGLLVNSGVPLLESLRIASQVLDNVLLRDASVSIAVAVQEGSSFSRALDHADVFPPLLTQMVSSGETNGKLADQLLYAARNQERELEFSLNAMLSLLEPAMILFMAGLVGFIVMSILLPIFQMNDIAG
ncbi:MAG: general secretion pathway protein F [Flavobacteriales bacterium]|jgi:general secretion pathway protein F